MVPDLDFPMVVDHGGIIILVWIASASTGLFALN